MHLKYSLKLGQDKIALTQFFFIRCTVFQILLIVAFGASVAAQDTTKVVDVYLKGKEKITGRLISRDKDNVVVVTGKSDTVSVPQNNLLGIVSAGATSPIFYQSNFAYKYFISSSSIPAEKGAWHYSNQNLFFNSIHHGISKNLTAGFSVSTFVQFYAAPKIKYCFNPSGKYKIAINTQYMYMLDWTSNERSKYNYAFVQGLITKGNSENNVTLGAGKAVANTWVSIDYFVTLAFKRKISNRLSFISDNSLLTNKNNSAVAYLFSGGFRIEGKNHAFDLGVFTPPLSFNFSNVVIPIPFLSYSLKVNR